MDLFSPGTSSLSQPLILIAGPQTPVRCIWEGETFLPLSMEVMGTGNIYPHHTAGSQLMFMLLCILMVLNVFTAFVPTSISSRS